MPRFSNEYVKGAGDVCEHNHVERFRLVRKGGGMGSSAAPPHPTTPFPISHSWWSVLRAPAREGFRLKMEI